MARFLHSIIQPNTNLVASVDITPFDLPVNPLSFLLLRLQITRVDPTTELLYSAIDDLITQITAIRVLHKGEQIIQGSLRDLMVMNMVYQRAFPGWSHIEQTNNSLSSIVFPLCLGRRLYDPVSCFFPTQRGNLRFEMSSGPFGAAYDDVNFSLEAVELIEANPTEHVKYVTSSRTSVAGQFDLRLPIGNSFLGILLFDTGIAEAADEVSSWGTIKLLKDNVEQYYPLSDYETLAAMIHMQMMSIPGWPGHIHQYDGSEAAIAQSADAARLANSDYRGYAFLDFDPLRDLFYELETAGASDILLRGNGDAAQAVRAIPLERVVL